MATTIKPPTPLPPDVISSPSVFLAGSIESGTAEHWQSAVETALADLQITILNPRRDQWDSSWVQSIDNPQFREQVDWELDGLHRVDMIAMYFDPNTKSPVTLMELGLWAPASMRGSTRSQQSKAIVCCPDGFWRKGNVDIVCSRFGVLQVPTLSALVDAIRARVVHAKFA